MDFKMEMVYVGGVKSLYSEELTFGKKYIIDDAMSNKEGTHQIFRIEYSWYGSSEFMTPEDYRESQLEKLGIET